MGSDTQLCTVGKITGSRDLTAIGRNGLLPCDDGGARIDRR